MEDYIDLNVIKRRLSDGTYMNQFSFTQDVAKIWERVARYGDGKVKRVAENVRERYTRMRRELEEIPIKRY